MRQERMVERAIRTAFVFGSESGSGGLLGKGAQIMLEDLISQMARIGRDEEGQVVAYLKDDGTAACTAAQKESGEGPRHNYNSRFNLDYFNTPLYTHPPAQPVPASDVDAFIAGIQEAVKSGETQNADMCLQALRVHLTAKPKVPESLTVSQCSTSEYCKGWNDCRRAMFANPEGAA